jgi:hypothetical protein
MFNVITVMIPQCNFYRVQINKTSAEPGNWAGKINMAAKPANVGF